MNIEIIQNQAEVIYKMDKHLRSMFQDDTDKLWENTFIKSQIDKRNMGGIFSISDHIRAMVYSMLSSGIVWSRISKEVEASTVCSNPIDIIFHNYNPTEILRCSPEQLRDKLKKKHCASQFTLKQMNALINDNIPKLLTMEKEYGTIDNCYRELIQSDGTLLTLVKILSDTTSKDKMVQMDIALVCEYLRNVGYDIPKPDRHIRRILGSEILSFSHNKIVSPFQAYEIIYQIAKILNKPVAEIDYILWSYCANGYGEICTSTNPKCERCVVNKYCSRFHLTNISYKTAYKYLLYSHYGMKESDGVSEIIFRSAKKSYLSFCRHISFQNTIPVDSRQEYERETEELLSNMIPDLLKMNSQELFDQKHHEICEAMIHVHDNAYTQNYGVAQRWLNLTLLNLVVIDSIQPINSLHITDTRKYFHVPVDKYLIQAASTQVKNTYQYGLCLKCSPMKYPISDNYRMDWYRAGEVQPFEKWEYSEYIEFQNLIRYRLKDSDMENIYIDMLDWAFNAFLEVSQLINR